MCLRASKGERASARSSRACGRVVRASCERCFATPYAHELCRVCCDGVGKAERARLKRTALGGVAIGTNAVKDGWLLEQAWRLASVLQAASGAFRRPLSARKQNAGVASGAVEQSIWRSRSSRRLDGVDAHGAPPSCFRQDKYEFHGLSAHVLCLSHRGVGDVTKNVSSTSMP